MNKTQKLKSLIVLKDNFEMNDFLTIIKMKIRDYVLSDEFAFEINPNVTSPGYVTIGFNVDELYCQWSINERGFICYHYINCVDKEFGKILNEKEEKKFCKLFFNKLYPQKDKSKEISSVKKQISELEKVLNVLEGKE